ncbi:MAG: hypothetical protein AABY15_07525 [Nanoarchaeota archaeon]
MEKIDMEEKRKVAADVDEVLLDFFPIMNDFYNKRFGTNLSIEDYVYYDLEKVWGCTRQKAVEIVFDFYRSQEFKQILPVKRAQKAIERLSRSNELSVVTSRPSFIEADTKNSLNKYFGNVFNEIFHNGQYGVNSSGLDKSSYCLKNGIFVILEDNLDIARKCAEKDITTFLFDKPWNKNSNLSSRIIRVGEKRNPWEEVLEHLK